MAEFAEASDSSVTTGTAFAWSIGLSSIAAAVQIAAFGVLRSRAKWYYEARLGAATDPAARGEGPPEALPAGTFAWVRPLLAVDEAQTILATGGLDATVYLRLLRLGVTFFAASTVLGLGVLVPVYATGTKEVSSWLDEIGVGHIEASHSSFYAPIAYAYVTSALLMALLWREFSHLNALRHKYGAVEQSTEGLLQRHVVLVTDVADGEDRSESKHHGDAMMPLTVAANLEATGTALGSAAMRLATGASLAGDGTSSAADVEHHFERIFPGSVIGAAVVTDTAAVRALYDRYDSRCAKMEIASVTEPGSTCCGTTTLEDVTARREHCMKKLEDSERALLLGRENAQVDPRSHVAFVCLKNATTAHSAARGLHAANSAWETSTAPYPSEIEWGGGAGLLLRWWERYVRSILVKCALVAFTALFMIPLTALSGMTNLTTLSTEWKWLEWYGHIPESIRGLIEGALPSLILIIFFALVPPILRACALYRGMVSTSQVALFTIGWFFAVMVISISWTTVAQAVLSQISSGLLDAVDVSQILTLLATGVPSAAFLYLNFLVIKSVGGLPGELLGLVPLLIKVAVLRWRAKTPRQVREALECDVCPYAAEIPNVLLLQFIGILYAPLQPLISPFSLLASGLAYVVWKHQLLYVYRPTYETYGTCWLPIFGRTIFSLVFGQVVLAAVLFFGEAWVPLGLCAPLIAGTLFFDAVSRRRFESSFQALPLETAAAFDECKTAVPTKDDFLRCYRPPWLVKPVERHADDAHPEGEEA